METKTKKTFDSVEFFREIKRKLGEKLSKMTLEEQKDFLQKICEGKIKLT